VRSAGCIVGGQQRLEEESEKPPKSFEEPSKFHRSSIEVPSKHHAHITLTSRQQQAEWRLAVPGLEGFEARQEGRSGRQGPGLVDQ